MPNRNTTSIFKLCALILIVSSCSKNDNAQININVFDYYPLKIGKYITYRLDSTVFENFNTQRVTKTYIVQDIIDAIIKDNQERDAYRIRRMIRSNYDTTKWADNSTFVVTAFDDRIEFQENNLRFIKLTNPISTSYSWKGNSKINVIDDYLRFYENWDYMYDKINEPYTVNNKTFPETLTVLQADKLEGNPLDPKAFYEKTKSVEVYAKSIGLVYKEFIHEFWQPSTANFQTNSYGVKLTILNHNF